MFGRRSDGHLVKKLDPIVALTSYIMPTRCDAQIFTDYKADFEKLARYIAAKSDEGYRITFMEIIIAAYIRTVSQLPEINRFIANKRLYARSELAMSFALVRDLVEPDILRPDPRDSSTSVVIRLRLVWRRAGALVGDHIFQPDIDIAKDIPEELNQTLSVCLSRLCRPSLRMSIADPGKIRIVFGVHQSQRGGQYSSQNR